MRNSTHKDYSREFVFRVIKKRSYRCFLTFSIFIRKTFNRICSILSSFLDYKKKKKKTRRNKISLARRLTWFLYLSNITKSSQLIVQNIDIKMFPRLGNSALSKNSYVSLVPSWNKLLKDRTARSVAFWSVSSRFDRKQPTNQLTRTIR